MRPPGARQGKSTLSVPEAALLERLGVSLDRGQAQLLEAYGKLVTRWNRVGRLVAKGDLCRFASRHLLDSLVLVPLIRELEGSGDASGRTQAQDHEAPLPIADFGSGAGLPGIPLAIALPDLSFTLVERSARKARFLRRVQDELTLLNVRVLCTDIRDLPRAAYRGVVARAVMPVPALWPRARAALTPGGYLLVLDSIARCRDALQPASQELCEGGAVRRHWVEMQELHAWHGVLEVRETSP